MTTSTSATAIPATAMRYRDVAAAADWLCSAFGFVKQTVLSDDNGAPLYVQLTCGRAMLMLAPVRPSPIDKYMRQPDEIGGAETQSGYYVVADADAHCARAKAAGAAIILDIEDDDFGGRTYTCRDPEGHIWTFGTYDPWQGRFPGLEAAPAVAAAPSPRRRGRRLARAVLILIFVGGAGAAGWYGRALTQSRAFGLTTQAPAPAVMENRAALEAAEDAARKALVELETERAAKADAEQASTEAQRAAQAAQAKEASERVAREEAERAAQQARAELEKLQAATKTVSAAGNADLAKRADEERKTREAAERALKDVRAELEKERAAKAAAAAGSAELSKRVDDERHAREAAERALKDARGELDKARTTKVAVAPGSDQLLKRVDEERQAREAAEQAAKAVRAELEKARSDKAAAEMAKDFALNRAEEEQTAREAAEQAAKEMRGELDAKQQAAPVAVGGPPPDVLKTTAEMQRALDEAKKRADDAESSINEMREQLAKEKAAKNAAWKVVSQLTRQLRAAKGSTADDSGEATGEPPPKKAKVRLKKKKSDE